MSVKQIQCKYLTSDKLSSDRLKFKCFHCEDMSVTKSSDKTYDECKFEDKTRKIRREIKFYEENDNCPTCHQGIYETHKCNNID